MAIGEGRRVLLGREAQVEEIEQFSAAARAASFRAARRPRARRSTGRPSAARYPARTRCSLTDTWRKTVAAWKLRAIPSRAIAEADIPVIARPSKATVPPLGFSEPARRLKTVVLPAPFGPIRPASGRREGRTTRR